jgi:hypothetical protein
MTWHSQTTTTTAHPGWLCRRASTHHAADLHLRCARRPEVLTTPELLTRVAPAASLPMCHLHAVRQLCTACLAAVQPQLRTAAARPPHNSLAPPTRRPTCHHRGHGCCSLHLLFVARTGCHTTMAAAATAIASFSLLAPAEPSVLQLPSLRAVAARPCGCSSRTAP